MPELAAAIPFAADAGAAVTAVTTAASAIPGWVTAAGLGLQAASTIAGAAGQIEAGKQQKATADYAAKQATAAGKSALAEGSNAAANEARKTSFAVSAAQANAAASGADTTSPSVVNDESNLSGVGEYNVMSALFTGQSRQNAYNQQALTDVYQGKSAKQASMINAGTTIAKSGASMLEQYGNAFQPSGTGGNYKMSYGPNQTRLPWQEPGWQY